MDFRHHISGGSPSSSSTTSSSSHNPHHHNPPTTTTTPTPTTTDPIHSWWESISKARSRIQLLSTILQPEPDSPNPISSLADSDNPAHSLLSSLSSYSLLSLSLSSPSSGSGHDPLCHWLYDTFLSSDPHLRLVVLSFIPLISGLYLSRLHSPHPHTPSLSGFEAVLLSLYSHETKSRAGKPLLINIPDLSLPSLYHSPRPINNNNNNNVGNINNINNNGGSGKKGNMGNMGKGNNAGVLMKTGRETVGVLAAPLEPQTAIKSTKRAVIVGVALDCYYKVISQMPSWSKRDFCRFAADWAGQDCVCKSEFDRIEESGESEERVRVSDDGEDENHENHEIEIEDNVVENMKNLGIEDENLNGGVRGTRIMLPWELLQPTLRILGHCLLGPLNSDDVKDAASVAVRCLYARASHDLVPQAILATRSLIQLDKRAREAAKMAAASAANTAGSNANTPSKAKKPEILLVSK